MTAEINRRWVVAERPVERTPVLDDWRLETGPRPNPGPGEILARTLWLGFDPAQRGWMSNSAAYMAPVAIGDTMPAFGLVQVVESRNPDFAPGDILRCMPGWTDYAVLSPGSGLGAVERIDLEVPLTANLSLLHTAGLTAYFGLLDVGQPRAGDTVVVSAAAGAVGSLAGQIARLAGCRVVGIAGGPEKCAWLGELGFDAAVDYKPSGLKARLAAACPDGIDVYFDNVGGRVLEAALSQLARRARVVICGGISRYGADAASGGPRNYFNLIFTHATMTGFLMGDYEDRYPEARGRMAEWLRSGQIRLQEDVAEGLENAPRTLMRLFEGRNLGKQLLKLADPA